MPNARVERFGVLDEAVASLNERKIRTALSALGTVLGVGVLVAVLGLTSTATSQIDRRFTELSATEVTITQLPDDVRTRSMAFPSDFELRVRKIVGVRAVGLAWTVSPDLATVQPAGIESGTESSVQVIAASPGAMRVAITHIATGRVFDDYAETSRSRVAVLGPTVAASLGISDLRGQPSLTIGGTSFSVIGILEDVERHPELLNAVSVPTQTALALWGDPSDQPPSGWVSVRKGAGQVVASQLAIATDPRFPDRFEVIPPPDPKQLRGSINEDLQALFLVLAGVCLIVGMVGIANISFVTVMERLGEIGLRRALGARRVHIAVQFLAEASVVGLVGGMLGALLGSVVTVVVAIANGWTAVLPSGLVLVGPALGALTALVAATYPALRAAHVEPIAALSHGT